MYFQQSLKLCEEVYPEAIYPKGHPQFANQLANLGTLAMRQGNFVKAWRLLNQAMEMSDECAELFVASVSEAEAMRYVSLSKGMYDRVISCAVHLPDSVDASYAHVWRRKSLVARMLQHRQSALVEEAGLDPAERRMFAAWNNCRLELARLILAPPVGKEKATRRIQQLTEEKERLERQLASSLPDFLRNRGQEQALAARVAGGTPPRSGAA